MTLIFGGYPASSEGGGGGGSTSITWKYPEMAMCLVDKDKFDAIEWNSQDQMLMAQNFSAFTDSVLVNINECELIYPDTFMEDLQTVGQADVDLKKNNQRIATMTTSMSQQTITFSNLAGELSNKNIQHITFGQQPNGESVIGMGINTNAQEFILAVILIYVRDYMNIGGEG